MFFTHITFFLTFFYILSTNWNRYKILRFLITKINFCLVLLILATFCNILEKVETYFCVKISLNISFESHQVFKLKASGVHIMCVSRILLFYLNTGEQSNCSENVKLLTRTYLGEL